MQSNVSSIALIIIIIDVKSMTIYMFRNFVCLIYCWYLYIGLPNKPVVRLNRCYNICVDFISFLYLKFSK